MLSKLQYNDDIKNTFVKIKKKPKSHVGISLFFNEYNTKKIVLKKYKLNELKQIAKSNKLHISGTKKIIIERIQEYFNKCIKCVEIQKMYRGFIVRQSFKLRGEEYKNRELCINTSDFYSMEPLNDIPIEYLFTFK
jgi:tRNA U34 5-carboxymethylaminomethyl modifying enzyme MnmG/GidA